MVPEGRSAFVGVGIYSVPEAARLSGVSTGRIRRWLRGYTYAYRHVKHKSPPVWQPQLPLMDGRLALGFRDLIEVRFVDAFRRHGVSWSTIRLAAERARALFETTHPFSTRRFKTDGRDVFALLVDETGEEALLDVIKSQLAFHRVLMPYLRGLDFADDDQVARWWPLGPRKRVVMDPMRCFGRPVVHPEGVPTEILHQAVDSGQSVATVAAWYEVHARSVRDAIEFEKKLVA